ncbi:acyltransferase domain-containing protein [Streptomyces kunmingensis]|uniref:Acyltransferase domain-containing protein n=1 Tax=Streptomyces kunmingensis TaxID=68225 RepID=A0ABU6CLJ9_9ACTN|nr:acyltransferase domain-containing protein [Streptomyces kunmingensis]MEB3965608.1 acyltransferase domain-containing protein [Streptomyces kunmingensis]
MLDVLKGDEACAAWLAALDDPAIPRLTAELPDAFDLPDVLLDLAVPHEDINELVRLRAELLASPVLRALLERAVGGLLSRPREPGGGTGLPVFPAATGALGRCFAVFVFVAALPYTRAHHRERGIPDDVSRRTLADLGRNLAVHRRRFGTTGLLVPWWPTRHFRGELYQLGRLQFERVRLGRRTGEGLAATGAPLGPGTQALSMHIPDFRGPMSPEACDDSLARAREFFALHYPEEPGRLAVCHSWLLDRQLKQYLPADSNIIRYQDRFDIAALTETPDDDSPVAFVFGGTETPRGLLPRRTSLQRAVLDHLDAGGHWYPGIGWFRM